MFKYQNPALLIDPVTGSIGYVNPVTGREVTIQDPLNVNIGGGTATLSSLNITGVAQFANGSAPAPSIAFASVPNTGIYTRVSGYLMTSVNGVELGYWGPLAAGGNLAVSQGIGLAGGTTSTNAADAFLMRDAANTLAQRNGTAAQTFNLYGTYTDAANYERLVISSAVGSFTIAAQSAGTGTANIALTLANKGTAVTALTGQTVGTTVGVAGAAAALPTAPLGYLSLNINGTAVRVPYYN